MASGLVQSKYLPEKVTVVTSDAQTCALVRVAELKASRTKVMRAQEKHRPVELCSSPLDCALPSCTLAHAPDASTLKRWNFRPAHLNVLYSPGEVPLYRTCTAVGVADVCYPNTTLVEGQYALSRLFVTAATKTAENGSTLVHCAHFFFMKCCAARESCRFAHVMTNTHHEKTAPQIQWPPRVDTNKVRGHPDYDPEKCNKEAPKPRAPDADRKPSPAPPPPNSPLPFTVSDDNPIPQWEAAPPAGPPTQLLPAPTQRPPVDTEPVVATNPAPVVQVNVLAPPPRFTHVPGQIPFLFPAPVIAGSSHPPIAFNAWSCNVCPSHGVPHVPVVVHVSHHFPPTDHTNQELTWSSAGSHAPCPSDSNITPPSMGYGGKRTRR